MSWHEGFPVCELRWNDGRRLNITSFYKKGFAGRAICVRCHGWRMSWPFCFSLSLKGVVQKIKCSLLAFLVLFARKRTFKQTKREAYCKQKREANFKPRKEARNAFPLTLQNQFVLALAKLHNKICFNFVYGTKVG